jgi:mRNA interferase RelE/StbE
MRLYQLEIPKAVRRQIDNLPGRYRQRIKAIIQSLRTDPRPDNTKLLREKHQVYRIALDEYRIVYSIDDYVLIVEVVKVGRKHGPEFYAEIK